MDIQQRKEQYLKKKYSEIASSILELINTPEKLKQEVKSSCYGLWRIYHHLDLELDYINTILETENGTKERSRRPRCDSCDEYRVSSPTF
jgi:hypothetical protein